MLLCTPNFNGILINSRRLGPNIGIMIGLVILILSLIVFVIKHPFEEVGVRKILLKVVLYICILFFIIMVMFFIGHYKTTARNVYYVTIFVIEALLNLTIPYFYIESKPNLKEYVIKSVTEGINSVISLIALFIADVINGTYNFVLSLKPSPRVYPTIE